MSDSTSPSNPWRSTGAVLAGLLATMLFSFVTDFVMHAVGVYPHVQPMSDGLFVLATVYRIAFAVLGGYVAAALAPRNPLFHALVLGGIGFVLALIGLAATWGKSALFGPVWYPIVLVLTALPATWLGAKLRLRGARA